MDLSNNRSSLCFFSPYYVIDIYLIVINCTLIMPDDELSEQLFDSRATSYFSFFHVKIGLRRDLLNRVRTDLLEGFLSDDCAR